jgi:thioredoxin-related protein
MSRKIIIVSVIVLFLGIFMYFAFNEVTPKDIENAPDWVPIETAMQKAADDNKLVFIDIYEIGCRFCRAMDNEVYPAPAVRAVLDRGYHPVKMNGHSDDLINFRGEEMSQKQFASMLGVTAYPFTIIMDAEGNVLDRRRGYSDIVSFSRFLGDALNQRTES